MRLLIVTDDVLLELSLKQFFTAKGYKVDKYDSCNTLLGNNYPVPDVFILDEYTSGVDTLDICNYLKHQATTTHIPIIIISAGPARASIYSFEKVDSFIEKPFRNDDLLSLIEAKIGILH